MPFFYFLEDTVNIFWNNDVDSESGFNIYRCQVNDSDCGLEPADDQLTHLDLPRNSSSKLDDEN